MQVRWVIAGTFAAMGVYWLALKVLFMFGGDPDWTRYGAHASAALAVGALMVAHAPMSPWREPAVAGALAIVLMWVHGVSSARQTFGWLQPWPVALGVAAVSTAMAAAGGHVARRFTAAARTALIVALSAGVAIGLIFALMVVTDRPLLSVVLGVLGGGFVTQAAVTPRRLIACGSGAAVCAAFSAPHEGAKAILNLLIGIPFLFLIGALGASLAWRYLRRGDAPSAPAVPPARLS